MKKIILLILLLISLAFSVFANEIPDLGDEFSLYEIDSFANVSDGLCQYRNSDHDYGYRKLNGEIVTKAEFSTASVFSEGLAYVKKTNASEGGYINTKGEYILPPVFLWGENFRNGKAIVNIYGVAQIINKKGEFLLPKNYVYATFNEIFNGYICNLDGKSDLYDENLRLIKKLDFMADDIVKVKEKLFIYGYSEDKFNCVVDFETLKVILPRTQNYIYHNNNDFFFKGIDNYYYKDDSFNFVGGATCYDISGKIFSDYGFQYVTVIDNNTHYGSDYSYDDGKHTGYIVKNGIKKKLDYAVYYKMSDDFILVFQESQKCGAINKKGNIVLPIEYRFMRCTADIAIFEKDGVRYVFNSKGNIVKKIENATYLVYSDGYYNYATLTDSNSEFVVLDKDFKEYFRIKGNDLYVDFIIEYGVKKLYYDQKWYAVFEKGTEFPEYDELKPVKYDNLKQFDKERAEYMKWVSEEEIIYLKLDSFKIYTNVGYTILDKNVPATKPYLENGLTMVPVSLISDIFHIYCTYNDKSQTVEFSNYDKKFTLNINSKRVNIHDGNENSEFSLPVEVKIVDGRTMVPLRAISELLNKNVFWDDSGLIGVSTGEINPKNEEIVFLNQGFLDYTFTPEDLLKIDASLATQPFTDYLSGKLLGLPKVTNICNYSNTIPGYEALIAGEKDLILVTEPSKEMLEKAEGTGVELEITPFSKEGFVFLVNSENGINNLSIEQVKDIYRGKIKNWSKLGGENLEIKAYQRNANSGSQTIMESFFMKDEIMAAPVERKIQTMLNLMSVIAEYDENINGGIGYSVYYYAKEMYGSDNVRLIKINDIEPTSDTIRDNSYPLIVNYYIVTRKDDNSFKTKALKEFILSEEGQKYVNESGLVSVK